MRIVRFCVVSMMLFAATLSGFSQAANEQGIKPYGSYHGSDLDQINVSNTHLELRIPTSEYPQRGGRLKLGFIARLHNAVWNERTDCAQGTNICFHIWEFDQQPGVSVVPEQAAPFVDQTLVSGGNTQNPVYAYSVRLADESEHPLENISGSTFESLNATGMKWDSSTQTVTLSDGTRYTNIFNGPPVLEDLNGNQITFSPGPNGTITDTLGRSIPWPGAATSTQDFSGCTGASPITSAALWVVPGANGGSNTFKLCYTKVHVYTAHWHLQDTSTQKYIEPNGDYTLLQSVVLPDQTAWTFDYSQPDANGINWGDLTKITLPTGGTISYTWTHFQGCHNLFGPPGSWSGHVTQRTLDPHDGTGPHSWTYGAGSGVNQVKISDPLLNDTVHTFTELGTNSCSFFETKTDFYQGSQSGGTLLKSISTDYSWTPMGSPHPPINVVPIRKTLSWPNGQVRKTEFSYDSGFTFNNGGSIGIYGKEIARREYDYGAGSPGALLKSVQTSYLWQASAGSQYLAFNILEVPSVVTVQDGSGNRVSHTTLSYDEALTSGSGISTSHDLNPPNGNVRGNATTSSAWLSGSAASTTNCSVSVTNGFLATTKVYLDTGLVSQSKDACGQQTNLQYSSLYAGAYLTSSCDALNHCSTMDYDLNTGAITGIADPNGQVTGKKTTYTYDAIGRITSITHPDGGQTNAYYLNPTTVEVKKLQDSAANVWIDSYTYFDGLLRPKQTRLVDPEGDVYSETTYDALGRVATTTNPHRTAAAPTDGTTTKHYDALGRVTSVVQPDNNSLQTLYSDPGVVTLIDETGRLRRETHDALGRLITVEEPSGGSPGNYSLSSPPAWPTLYSYDVLGNLLRVEQHGSTTDSSQWRVRSFQYDSLSRLTQSNNPETGQINFTYDADGNNITRSDARGVTATRAYDGLNRLVQQSYSDGTPTEAFGYDQTSLWGVSLANTVGRLSSTAAGATGSIVSYDPMGRIVSQFVCLPSNCGTGSYPIAAGYDLAGHQTSLTYPSGRTVTSSYSSAGRSLSSIFTNFAGVSQNYSYYAVPQARTPGAWGYNPDGSLHQGTFGNGISETYGFNNRLQLNSITASSSSQTWLSKIYGLYDANNNNNGIILSITDGTSSSRNQSYQYDAVGRVVAGSQQDGAFNQTFSYDPWGNMTTSGTNNFNPLFDGNNRVSGAPANCTGANEYCYDVAGNMMNDGLHQYAYDGYNRIKSVDGTGATYTYDAGGQRIRKNTGGKSTEYVDFQGAPIAEKDLSTGYWSDYVFFNGKRIAKSDVNDIYIQTQGTVCANCGWQWEEFHFALPLSHPLYHYSIQPGDKLYVRQHETAGTGAGIGLGFTDGTYTGGNFLDQDGNPAADDTVTVGWHYRQFSLNAYAGKLIGDVFLVTDGPTSAGQWSASYDDFVLQGADGTVRPVYTRETTASLTTAGTSGQSGVSWNITIGTATPGDAASRTYYYHDDQIGSARLMTSGGGWPVWQGTFTPFGQEVSPQITNNHYKFNGKERGEASEGGLDYYGARSYSSVLGRWVTPDWSDEPSPIPYAKLENPQSLNLYSYVTDDPLSQTDVDGHFQSAPANQLTSGDKCARGMTTFCQQAAEEAEARAQAQSQGHAVPLPVVVGRTGAAATGTAATGTVAAAVTLAGVATIVVLAADLLITRSADAIVANNEDKIREQAVYSSIAHENAVLMASNTKQQREVLAGLFLTAAEHIGKINNSDPNDPRHNGWKKEIKAALDRAEKIANRLPGKLKDQALQKISSFRGSISWD